VALFGVGVRGRRCRPSRIEPNLAKSTAAGLEQAVEGIGQHIHGHPLARVIGR